MEIKELWKFPVPSTYIAEGGVRLIFPGGPAILLFDYYDEDENIYVISRLIEGQFPDYNRVIPKEFKTHVNINKNEFQSALDRVSLISRSGDYNIIHFEFVDNIVRISSDNPNIGKAEETINVDIEGPGINISFNAKYIIDVLKAIDAENFIFSFNQPLTTASITQRDNKNFVYVVTPVRTKNM